MQSHKHALEFVLRALYRLDTEDKEDTNRRIKLLIEMLEGELNNIESFENV